MAGLDEVIAGQGPREEVQPVEVAPSIPVEAPVVAAPRPTAAPVPVETPVAPTPVPVAPVAEAAPAIQPDMAARDSILNEFAPLEAQGVVAPDLIPKNVRTGSPEEVQRAIEEFEQGIVRPEMMAIINQIRQGITPSENQQPGTVIAE